MKLLIIKDKINDIAHKYIPFILAIIALGYAVYFINFNYYALMNGDTSSELVLSKILAEEGGVLSTNWFYSTELRVLNTQLIYKLIFLLIPNNWKYVRLLSDVIMLLLLATSYIFMMASLNMKRASYWTVWMLFLPFGPNYGYMIVYSAFYIPHIVITFITIGLVAHAYKTNNSRRRVVSFCMLMVLAMASGLGGARQALVCYIPLILTGMIDFAMKFLSKKSKPYLLFIISVSAFLSFFVGLIINTKIFHGVYSFKDQTAYRWEQISLTNLLQVLSDLISLCGFCFVDVSFMGVYGFVNFLALGFVFLVIISIIVLFLRVTKLNDLDRIYFLFTIIDILFCGFIYSCTKEGYSVTYWLPLMPLLFPLLPFSLKITDNKQLIQITPLLYGYVILTFFLVSHITLKHPFDERFPFVVDGRDYMISGQVLKNLPSEGYSLFWIGNMLTELTDGEADIWITDDASLTTLDELSSVSPWLQKKSHAESLPSDEFFVLTYRKILDDPSYSAYSPLFWDTDHLAYENEFITIYVFKNLDDYRQTLAFVQSQGY